MVVSPDHRRMGIASLLIEALIAHAQKNHVPSISLLTTQFQDPARRLYQKFGWVEQSKTWMRSGVIGVWVFCYQLDLNGAQGAA
jgi:GNAT superfamily N-acetyltransferase